MESCFEGNLTMITQARLAQPLARRLGGLVMLAVVASWCCGSVFQLASAQAADASAREFPPLRILETSQQIRFGVFGEKPPRPQPVVFLFSAGFDAMRQPSYTAIGRRLAPHGFLTVTMEPPCFGSDSRPGEPVQLLGWCQRIENGERPIDQFVQNARAVLDHLIAEGYADSKQVVAVGSSCGGFLALHFAASDRRVQAVAAISPVMRLSMLSEFYGTTKPEAVAALDVEKRVTSLAMRPVWISIGNLDERAGTDAAIALFRQLIAATVEAQENGGRIPVELFIGSSVRHQVIAGADELAARWLLEQTNRPRWVE